MPTYLYPIDSTAGQFNPGANRPGVLSQVITLATSDLLINTVLEVGYLPEGAKVLDVVMVSTDLDTNGTPLLVLAVGDSGQTDRFINASTVGQTSGTIRAGNNATSSALFVAHSIVGYTAATEIIATVITAAATAAAGTLVVNVSYSVPEV